MSAERRRTKPLSRWAASVGVRGLEAGATRGVALSQDHGVLNPMRDRSFRDARQAHQPVAPAHDRRHDGAPFQGAHPEGLRSECENVCGLPRPVARSGGEGGPSPLSTAYGEAADERRAHQRRHRRVALLFRRDARTARPRSSSDDREQAAPSAGRAEPGGGGASARSRARPEARTWIGENAPLWLTEYRDAYV